MLRATIEIPRFPFANRKQERDAIFQFCSAASASRILVVEGEAGVGKTRLLGEVLETPDLPTRIIRLNFQKFEPGHLVGDLFDACRRLPTTPADAQLHRTLRETWLFVVFYLREFLTKSARALLPAGMLAEHLVSRALTRGTTPQQGRSGEGSILLRYLKDLASDVPLLIAVDDLHDIQQEDLNQLIDLISLTLADRLSQIRFILGTRPGWTDTSPELRRLFSRLVIGSHISRLELRTLDHYQMEGLVGNVLSNPASSGPLLDLAEGNPQKFLELLIKINYRGQLVQVGQLVQLPDDVTSLTYLADGIWDLVREDPIIAKLVGILAVGAAPVQHERLRHLLTALDLKETEFERVTFRLRKERLIEWRSPEGGAQGGGAYSLCFFHDALAEQIKARIDQGDAYERHVVNSLAVDYFRSFLCSMDPSGESALRSASSLCYPVPLALNASPHDWFRFAVSLWRAGEEGWDSLAIGVMRLCQERARHSEVLTLARLLLDCYRGVFAPDSAIIRVIRSSQVKANYLLGRWEDCVEAFHPECNDGEILYYYAISHLIAKSRMDSLGVARDALRTLRDSSSEKQWEPLLVTVEALCLQEGGQRDAAEEVYAEFLSRSTKDACETAQWSRFLGMAPLFLEPTDALFAVRSSIRFMAEARNRRGLGMAIHNAGFALLLKGRIASADRYFQRAKSHLKDESPHEMVFPLNNLAGVALVRGRYEEARDYLNQARFLRLSPYYEKQVLINLAYTSWGLGLENTIGYLTQIKDLPGLRIDTWSLVQIEYAKLFLELQQREVLDQAEFDLAWRSMGRHQYVDAVAPFWNVLATRLSARHRLDPRFLPTSGLYANLEKLLRLRSSPPIRPALLCFGHI